MLLVECTIQGCDWSCDWLSVQWRGAIGHMFRWVYDAGLNIWLVWWWVNNLQACDWFTVQFMPMFGHKIGWMYIVGLWLVMWLVYCTMQCCDWSSKFDELIVFTLSCMLSSQGGLRLVMWLVFCTMQNCDWSSKFDELFVFTLYPGLGLTTKLFWEKQGQKKLKLKTSKNKNTFIWSILMPEILRKKT